MAPIAAGDSLPDGTLAHFDENDQLQKVVIVGVPGAFTPTCSLKHVPGFIERAEDLRAKGVAEIITISVNDPFVMKACAKFVVC
ncbi:unnamed protein product [Linum tenue]|uniref:glutaredoxin-dependent peroxiredoxin n=1 Tax=Linum tenue TaxID=586396 RepID=A0AAV0QGK1_9ROSI|nr:unnamed protein product [Linum tenue]